MNGFETETLRRNDMPKLACPCGYIHDLTPIPDDALLTVRDREYDELIEAEMRFRTGHREPEEADGYLGRIYECPECGRLMWSDPTDSGYRVFRPDDGHV